MAANATKVMQGVKAALEVLYPDFPANAILTQKGLPSNDPGSFLCGWMAGYPSPCMIVTCPDPDPVDEFNSFEEMCVRYEVTVAYVKPVAGGKAPREDDDEIRQWRQNVRDNLYKPTLEGVAEVYDTEFKSRPPYTIDGGGTPAVSIAAEMVSFVTNEVWEYNPVP